MENKFAHISFFYRVYFGFVCFHSDWKRWKDKILSLIAKALSFFPERISGRLFSKIFVDIPPGHGPLVIVSLREQFSRDVDQLEKNTDLRFAKIPNHYVNKILPFYAKKIKKRQTEYQKHLNTDFLDEGVNFFQGILDVASKRGEISCFLSGNIDYWQDAPIKRISKTRNIPFVALVKEHPNIPSNRKNVDERYSAINFNFDGDKALVGGKHTYDFLIHNRLSDPSKIKITGFPRLDYWHPKIYSGNRQRNAITLITFNNKNYRGEDAFEEVLETFLSISESHQYSHEFDFIIKCKDPADYRNIRAKHQKNYSSVIFEYYDNLENILERSFVVIGLNSLAVMESLIAVPNVVIPTWGVKDLDEDLMFFPGKGDFKFVKEAETTKDLEDIFIDWDFFKTIDNFDERVKAINRLVFFDKDTPSSDLVRNELPGRP